MKINLARLKTTTLSALAETFSIKRQKVGNTLIIAENPLLKALEEEYKTYKELSINKQVYNLEREPGSGRSWWGKGWGI